MARAPRQRPIRLTPEARELLRYLKRTPGEAKPRTALGGMVLLAARLLSPAGDTALMVGVPVEVVRALVYGPMPALSSRWVQRLVERLGAWVAVLWLRRLPQGPSRARAGLLAQAWESPTPL